MSDLANIHNPYDFANPISSKTLFIGRKKELEEIRYYLDQAKGADRPINIAILGSRASGKTSLMNISEIEAKEREFCTVRIDLDESDVKTELSFFYKIFDGIIGSVCRCGAYGGIEGRTYDAYLEIINSYKIPEDKVFCPFLFPIQYAHAMPNKNYRVQLQDNNFKLDLLNIYKEIARPIILLFDEGNVLSNNRILIEKMRNIFMNIKGYMLIIAGTPELFPMIDEVFSPIIRQFKKIYIRGFVDFNETKECILRPLKDKAIVLEEVIDVGNDSNLKDIHNLSGGRPYEVQLICHYLFRRVQEGKSKKMRLNYEVCEDVRKELENYHEIAVRPILSLLPKYSDQQLRALGLLCSCDGYASFEQIWCIEYLFNKESKWRKTELYSEYEKFISHGIIKEDNGKIKFAGDEFDKIYIKYYSREKKIRFIIWDISLKLYFIYRLQEYIGKYESAKLIPIDNNINKDIVRIFRKYIILKDPFINRDGLIEEIYKLAATYRNKKIIPSIEIKTNYLGMELLFGIFIEDPKKSKELAAIQKRMLLLEERAKEFKYTFKGRTLEIESISFNDLREKIIVNGNENTKKIVSTYHEEEMYQSYLNNKRSEALFHAQSVLSYLCEKASWENINNLGYIYFSLTKYRLARNYFKKAAEDIYPDNALALFNLGIVEIKYNRYSIAKKYLEKALNKAELIEKKDRNVTCLYIPKIKNSKISFEEESNPDLLENIKKAIKMTEAIISI